MGQQAAIEAADIVIMDDDPAKIPLIKRIAKRTLSIAKQNVVFALVVKFAVLILGAVGLANRWLAVFADVGVSVICILNSMRMIVSSRKEAENI
jgi:Cd2+/Zn2+-exporting ATPase